jgi:uncharacterized protein with FMN-binding domain
MIRVLRVAAVLLAFGFLILFICGCRSRADIRSADVRVETVDISQVPDGDYWGEATDGPVKAVVVVEVKEGRIVSIVLEHHWTMMGKPAERIPDDVIRAQSLRVDTVSGATISSRAILKAIANALTQGMG